MISHLVHASSSGHLVVLVPQLLGYTPRRSLVLLPLRRGRTLGALRVDLPEEGTELGAFAATTIGLVCRVKDADSFVALAYAGDEGDDEAERSLMQELRRRADACGLGLVDAIRVGESSWRSYARETASGAIADAADEELRGRIAAVFGERDVSRAQGESTPVRPADERVIRSVARALHNLRAAAGALCGAEGSGLAPSPEVRSCPPGEIRLPGEPADPLAGIDPLALDAVSYLDDVVSLFEIALGWPAGDLAPYESALLLWCCTMPPLRDLALSCWAYGMGAADDILAAQLRWEAGEEFRSVHDGILMGDGPRPHVERLTRARELLHAVAENSPENLRRVPLTIAAWISWALGESSRAAAYLDVAEGNGEEYPLGDALRSLVDVGYLPPWAFEEAAAEGE